MGPVRIRLENQRSAHSCRLLANCAPPAQANLFCKRRAFFISESNSNRSGLIALQAGLPRGMLGK